MASNQSKLKRSIPLLLALVVLISCLPVIPAAAADTMSLSGFYTVGMWVDTVGGFSITCDGYVVVDGAQVQFNSIFIDERDSRTLWFSLSDGSVEGFFSYYGQSTTDDGCFYLSSVTISDSNAISFFSNYVTEKTFTASIIIDGAHNTLPCDSSYYYQMDVTSTGARFYNDFGSVTYTYNGVGEFLGFSCGGDTVVYSVGMSGVTMQGSVVELGTVSSFTTFITIDGTTYPFSSQSEKPSVTMAVTYSGATLSYGDQSYTYTYSGSGDFLGFSATGEAPAYYTPGNTYTLSAGPYSISSVVEVLTYKTTVFIGDQTYTFTSSNGSPEVHLVVNETGVVMSSGGTVFTYIYSGEDTFQGLSRVSDGSTITYPVGSSDYIHGTNTLYPISGDVYTSTITIDDEPFIFSSLTEQPAVTLNVTDTGATLVFNGEAQIYLYSGEGTFQGLSYSATGAASLVPGQSYELAAGNHTLYPIFSASGGSGSGSTQSYTSTITIDGQKFTFTSTTEQPAVFLEVTSTGATMTYGSQVLTYTYIGDGNFLGLGFSQYMDPSFVVGYSYPLAAGSHTFKAVNDGAGSGEGPFETTIVIDGSVFQFFSDTEYPLVTCYLSADGVTLVYGDDIRVWRPKYNEEFLGLALSANASEPSYSLSDEWFKVRGSSSEYAFQYYSYCVASDGASDLQRIFSAVASILVIPLSIFFTTEFIPGLSFSSILILSFVLGLIFFFLKSSK